METQMYLQVYVALDWFCLNKKHFQTKKADGPLLTAKTDHLDVKIRFAEDLEDSASKLFLEVRNALSRFFSQGTLH